jgi:hypothetical protein
MAEDPPAAAAPKDDPPTAVPKDKDSISAAKIAMYGTVTAAVVAAISGIVIAIVNRPKDHPPTPTPPNVVIPSSSSQPQPPPGAAKPPLAQPDGGIDEVTVSQDATQVTVTGHTTAYVVDVFVGPCPTAPNCNWKGSVAVARPVGPDGIPAAIGVELPWSALVMTNPHVPHDYKVTAFYDSRSTAPAGTGPAGPGPGGQGVPATHTLSPRPVAPDVQESLATATECGEKCLGPPSVYQGTISQPP